MAGRGAVDPVVRGVQPAPSRVLRASFGIGADQRGAGTDEIVQTFDRADRLVG